jgi:hypothetical protein
MVAPKERPESSPGVKGSPEGEHEPRVDKEKAFAPLGLPLLPFSPGVRFASPRATIFRRFAAIRPSGRSKRKENTMMKTKTVFATPAAVGSLRSG